MLKIGDFARLAGISSRMLRHYDHIGLLAPAQVDPATGYRWYDIEQLARLRRVRVLQELGFGLDEIAILLDASVPTDNIQALLAHLQSVLHHRIAADQTRLSQVEARLRAFDEPRMPEPGDALQSVTFLLEHHYGLPARNLSLLYPDHVYELSGADHTRWTIFLGRANAPGEHVYTTWLSGATGQTFTDFLLGRAALLQYLEACDYPAPRVVPTRAGETLGFHGPWCALVTRERGVALRTPTISHMQALGAALGRLHALESISRGAPAVSGWFYPPHALEEASYHVRSSKENVPTAWHGLLDEFLATLHAFEQAQLPRTLTHGNAFAGTALLTPEAQVALRLWHSAGQGVALLDLGRLLLGCHWDAEATVPQPIVPDQERISAVMEGYLAHRRLNAVERAYLLDAIRFSISYGAAEHLSRARARGWTPQLERKLAIRQQWYAASTEIAAYASTVLG